MQTGIIIIFTGEGKGKTSAALGTALRAAGHKQNVCIIQFIKHKHMVCGEHKALKAFLPQIELYTIGSGFITSKNLKKKTHQVQAQKAWLLAQEKILSGKFALVVLDELTHVISLKLISEQEVLNFLTKKPPHVNVLITGRAASSSLLKIADLVTECTQIKHPYKKGKKALKGIDY
ncbi:MAG: cob(I)yrinic acid a,c-diamide adenosyltransferase [Spirochaetales bacterium]|nr:cob(I)yrinic acid a,c-diamide adenosyltransferase [Spirochaetales bacterium]